MKIDIAFSNSSRVSMGPQNDIISVKFLNANFFLTKSENKTIQPDYTIYGSIPIQLTKDEF